MNKNPKVSIVVPVYNVEKYLEQCVESILKQTYKNLDIILVDDGSKDSSPQMCDAYAKKDSRFQVIHKENGGLMSAWMAGVKKAQGGYLVFVDSDDWIDSGMIEDMVSHIAGVEKEIICGNYMIEKKNQSIPVRQSMKPGVYDRKALEESLFPEILGNEVRRIHCSRCLKLISRQLILDNMKYCNPEITMGEDLNIMFPTMLDAERMVILEDAFYYHYRFVDASMVHKYNAGLSENIRELYQTLVKIIEKKAKNAEEKKLYLEGLKKEYIVLLFIVLKNELRGSGKHQVSRIQQILRAAEEEAGLERVTLEVKGKANQLLYAILKKPNAFRILFGKMVIGMFDKV